jgi:hypothetical protein
MARRSLVAAVAAAVVAASLAGSAAALSGTWSWADHYTDVNADNRTFGYRPPGAATGMQAAHELSARRNRGDASKGRAEAAVKTSFPPLTADAVRVVSFGRDAEADNDPVAVLRVYVRCVGELDTDWTLAGRTDVTPNTSERTLRRRITVEDCETQTVNGLMLQVLTGERGDRRRRTVFLRSAELLLGGAAVWTEDFSTP